MKDQFIFLCHILVAKNVNKEEKSWRHKKEITCNCKNIGNNFHTLYQQD